MMIFFQKWGEAAFTTVGFFWMALWAFALGYIISSMIQVFVTRERMKRHMGEAGPGSVGLATFFGFISSSCSFAALASTKSLFKKGAGIIPALAFLLASTNLVIELGIVIIVFLSWQFVVGEYIGGILLILIMWIFVKLTNPEQMVKNVRKNLQREESGGDDEEIPDWRKLIRSREGWIQVGRKYMGEWGMVWKDVTIGFTVAGIVSAFVPSEAFKWLFIGTANRGVETAGPSFFQVLENVLVAPLAAFMTFIGSMGNIPLAGLLYNQGVSMGGVMAFIFSDLVVFPVLRINAKYYGWKMALYILLTLLISVVGASLLIHYGFLLAGLQPQATGSGGKEQEFFKINYTLFLNLAFSAVSGLLVWLSFQGKDEGDQMKMDKGWLERLLYWLALVAFVWLAGGVVAKFLIN